jgi:tetraacyldisaccharide 4'-kinase
MDVIDLRSLKPPDEYGGTIRGLLLPVLVPLSGLYAAGARIWRMIPVVTHDIGIPVVSVGSLAVGGTGKTPACMHIAARFRDLGRKVCVLSRGYRRTSAGSPLVVSDGSNMLAGVRDAGDEPYMMAKRLDGVGVVVGGDRWEAALEARERLGAEMLILDDGFQVRNLHRQADVLCFDEGSVTGWNAPLPLGTLREGWSAIRPEHLVIILLKDRDKRPRDVDLARLDGAEIFYAFRSTPTIEAASEGAIGMVDSSDRRFALVSGLARPAAFERTCRDIGIDAPVSIRFEDHHWYSDKDVALIGDIIVRYGCTRVLTTEKDVWKMPVGLREITFKLLTDFDFVESDAFWQSLDNKLGAQRCLR